MSIQAHTGLRRGQTVQIRLYYAEPADLFGPDLFALVLVRKSQQRKRRAISSQLEWQRYLQQHQSGVLGWTNPAFIVAAAGTSTALRVSIPKGRKLTQFGLDHITLRQFCCRPLPSSRPARPMGRQHCRLRRHCYRHRAAGLSMAHQWREPRERLSTFRAPPAMSLRSLPSPLMTRAITPSSSPISMVSPPAALPV